MNQHLQPEQVYQLLDHKIAGGMDAAAEKHLAACESCRSEFESLHAALGNFRVAAIHLSRSHAPMQRVSVPPDRARRLTLPRAAWAGGLVAAMALCTASVSMLRRPEAPAKPRVQTVTTVAAVQSDDALLDGIDNDLSAPMAPGLEALDVTQAGGRSSAQAGRGTSGEAGRETAGKH